MAKMNLKSINRRRKSILNKIIVIISISLISSFFIIYYLNKKVMPNILKYATAETKKIATIIINKAIAPQTIQELDIKNLMTTNKDKDGKITSVDFNSFVINKILSSATNDIQLSLKKLEEGKLNLSELSENTILTKEKKKLRKGIIYEIPLGMAFNNAFLGNLGPKIPVKLNLMGDVEVNFKSNIKNYGINNALIEIMVNVKITEQVLLPIISDKVTIETDIPISIKLIEGSVPEYYSGNNNLSSGFSIPITD